MFLINSYHPRKAEARFFEKILKIVKYIGKKQRPGTTYDQRNLEVLLHRLLLVTFVEENMYVIYFHFL